MDNVVIACTSSNWVVYGPMLTIPRGTWTFTETYDNGEWHVTRTATGETASRPARADFCVAGEPVAVGDTVLVKQPSGFVHGLVCVAPEHRLRALPPLADVDH
jgi:hypothetical protein